MNLFKSITNLFTKSEQSFSIDELPFYNYSGFTDGSPTYIKPRTAYNMYQRNADLGKAVGGISDATAGMKKGISDGSGEIDYKAPIMEILNNPKGGLNRSQFWSSITESYELTQSIYIVARGNITRPPLELVFIRPYDVTIIMDDTTGEPSSIMTTSRKDRREYNRVEENGIYRYIDKTSLNELLVIRGKVSTLDEWSGQSPLTQLYYDIQMNTDGKRSNVSQQKNGSKPSLIISPKNSDKNIGAESVKSMTKYLRTFHQGSGNSGNAMVLSDAMEVNPIGLSNKDMDFLNLLNFSKDSIYNLYNVPLALISRDAQTYDNLTTAIRSFYTKAVFPVFDQIAEGLMDSLRDRYGMSQDETLTFSESDIRDLRPVLVENMVKLKETEVIKTNEIRRIGGYEDVQSGDDILVSANKVPLDFLVAADSFEQEVSNDSSAASDDIEPEEV